MWSSELNETVDIQNEVAYRVSAGRVVLRSYHWCGRRH